MWDRPRQRPTPTFHVYCRHYAFCIAAVLIATTVVVRGEGFTNRHLEVLDATQGGYDVVEAEVKPEVTPTLQVVGEADVEDHEQRVQGKGLPQCYSSAAADPSEGTWQRFEGSQDESPASVKKWAPRGVGMSWLQTCQRTWNGKHPNGESMPYWYWEPDNCSLRDVTAARFCHVMDRRKGILFVGDSLTHIFATTLAYIVRAEIVVKNRVKDVWSACEGKLKFVFIRNDHLDTRPSAYIADDCDDTSRNTAKMTSCAMFATDEILGGVDVLVVNSGAHMTEESVYGPAMRNISDSLASSMTRLHGNESILIARNTVPGHWHCTERMFDGPVGYDVAASLVAAGPETYGWNTIRARNVLLEEAFSAEKGWVLLDAYSPTILRADMHIGGKDCLHYCMPGPSNHWVTLLYNIILMATGIDEKD